MTLYTILSHMKHYLIALDQGTSSTRAILYQTDGKAMKTASRPVTQYYPEPGWVENCPEEMWQNTLSCLQEVLSDAPRDAKYVLGITNQRETTLLWHRKTGQCYGRAIVWQDRRTESICKQWRAFEHDIHERTGLRADPYFSASKIRWLLDNREGCRQALAAGELCFGTVDSFLIYRLTKGQVHATDVSNASRTMLFNLAQVCWDKHLLNCFDLPADILPEVKASDAYFGEVEADNIKQHIVIHGVAGDQQAALLGQHCLKPGEMKVTFGTGAFLLMNTGSSIVHSKQGLLATIAYQIGGQIVYGLEGSIYNAGTLVKWLRDELGIIQSAEETETLARSLPDNGGVYLIPAFTGLGAPYWTSEPCGMLWGLTRATGRAHFARAALEAVAYLTKEVVQAVLENYRAENLSMRVDGGMVANVWFLEFLQALTGLPMHRAQDLESSARGAAWLAGLAQGHTSLDTPFGLHTPIYSSLSVDAVQESYRQFRSVMRHYLKSLS